MGPLLPTSVPRPRTISYNFAIVLKRLAVLGLAIGLAGSAWCQGSRDQPNQTAEKQQQPNPKAYHYPWGELLAPANIPNWCLVLVGGLAAGMAYWTLRSIERQTEYMSRQGDLMREQLDRMVEKERARLKIGTITLELTSPSSEHWWVSTALELSNVGGSNVHIVDGGVAFLDMPRGTWPLPEPDPENLSCSNTIEPNKEPESLALFIESDATLPEFSRKVAESERRIYLYGFVEYETLGTKWHRDFGYVWTPEDPEESASKRLTGSASPKAAVQRLTAGGWEQDARQKNGEYEVKPKSAN